MTKALIPMKELPPYSGMTETICGMIHGAPYKVMMDGEDTYIYETVDGGKTLKLLCRLAGAELTERLGVALLRAATLQREAEEAVQQRNEARLTS